MSLKNKLINASTIKYTSQLDQSTVFNEKDFITTPVPNLNIALSGELDGGLSPGILQIAGPSKHFKSAFTLLIASSYIRKYPEGIILFYDSEFGTPESYFDSFSIDKSKVVHTPVTNIEELKHDIMTQLENIERGDKVCIIIDSLGNLASKKEVDDAIEGKSAADMTRAKQLKSLGRMITPHLTLKDIPLIAVNHVYKEMGLFPKDIVSGGCLAAGTKIQMFDDTIKNIEDVCEGEIVKTNIGPKLVTKTWTPETLIEGNPDCYEIEFEDGYKVICSDKHKFLIDNEWIEAKNLKNGEEVKTI